MYHLKDDGTAGVCRAKPGNCPKKDAIHGKDEADVYAQLEEVMKDQIFAKRMFPAPPERPSALEVGTRGAMMSYSSPAVVEEQYDALTRLGAKNEAFEVLKHDNPDLARSLTTGREVDWDSYYVEPQEYSYEGGDGHYYLATDPTWVRNSHYQMQTVALNHLMDTLETGQLKTEDVPHYETALGNTSKSDTAYLAFNYNPDRQPDDFWNGVKNRLVREGFSSTDDGKGNFEVNVPGFIWDGLDDERKARMATSMIRDKYSDGPGLWRHVKEGQTWAESYLASRESVNRALQATFSHNRALNGAVIQPGEVMEIDTGHIKSDASYPLVEVEYELTSTGFRSRHKRELFVSYHERGWRDSRTRRP